jgi:hypothetical protein
MMISSMSTTPGGGPEHRFARTLKLAVGLLAILPLSFAFRPDRWVVDRPVTEDAYYALSVSRNIAEGKGVTIDGSTPTNGFQPLFVFACVPLFALAGHDRILAIRLVLGLSWVLYVGTAVLLGQIVRDFLGPSDGLQARLTPWLAALLYFSAPLILIHSFNGLETGSLLFLYAAAWRCHQLNWEESSGKSVLFAMLLGLIVLARIDAAFFVVAACIGRWLPQRQTNWRQWARRFFKLAGISFVVSSGWWLNNLVRFHSILPSSGRAEQAWEVSNYRWERVAAALLRNLVPWVHTEVHLDRSAGTVIRAVFLLCVAAAGVKHRAAVYQLVCGSNSKNDVARRTLEFIRWLVASVAALAAWYALSSWAVHFYTRYMAPLILVAIFVLASAAASTCLKLPRVAAASAALTIVPVLVLTVLLWHGRPVPNGFLREQVKLVERYASPRETVAAGQSGTLGYFRSGVVNLDGKVNPRALEFQTRMWEYLPEVHARWLCDWPAYVRAYLGERPEKYGWKLVGKEGTFVLLRYEPPATLNAETASRPKAR